MTSPEEQDPEGGGLEAELGGCGEHGEHMGSKWASLRPEDRLRSAVNERPKMGGCGLIDGSGTKRCQPLVRSTGSSSAPGSWEGGAKRRFAHGGTWKPCSARRTAHPCKAARLRMLLALPGALEAKTHTMHGHGRGLQAWCQPRKRIRLRGRPSPPCRRASLAVRSGRGSPAPGSTCKRFSIYHRCVHCLVTLPVKQVRSPALDIGCHPSAYHAKLSNDFAREPLPKNLRGLRRLRWIPKHANR